MNKTETPEQRKHRRVPLEVTLNLRMTGEHARPCRGTISDLSQGGMTFETDAELEKGMTLHLKLPSLMQIRGEIRSASGPQGGVRRYGVRFHKVGHIVPTN